MMETLYRLPLNPPRSRRPDVSFVSVERWPLSKPIPLTGESWDVVPELAVEVVSPSDRANKLERKLTEYFEAGVRHVWVVHPEEQIAQVYKSRRDVQVFLAADELTDEMILPGFGLQVGSIFPPYAPTAESRKAD